LRLPVLNETHTNIYTGPRLYSFLNFSALSSVFDNFSRNVHTQCSHFPQWWNISITSPSGNIPPNPPRSGSINDLIKIVALESELRSYFIQHLRKTINIKIVLRIYELIQKKQCTFIITKFTNYAMPRVAMPLCDRRHIAGKKLFWRWQGALFAVFKISFSPNVS
jgi:hypothetical protein